MFFKPFILASLNTCLVFGYKRWNLMPMFRDLFLTSSTHTGVGSVIMCALVCHFENVLHNRPCDKFAFTKEAKTCEVVTLTRHYVMDYFQRWIPDSPAFDTHGRRLYGEDESNQPLTEDGP